MVQHIWSRMVHMKYKRTNLGFARMSVLELVNASENISAMRLGLASEVAATGGVLRPAGAPVDFGMGLTLERR